MGYRRAPRRRADLWAWRAVDLDEPLDPSGASVADPGRPDIPALRRWRTSGALPGIAASAVVAIVEEVIPGDDRSWLAWGSVGGRAILFAVDPASGREMSRSLDGGDPTSAIVEAWQLVLQPLD